MDTNSGDRSNSDEEGEESLVHAEDRCLDASVLMKLGLTTGTFLLSVNSSTM